MAHNHQDYGHHDHCCSASASSSVQQSMAEMEFERGIWSAAYDGENKNVEKFLRQGTNPNARDSSGITALHYAARNGHLAVCSTLQRKGATVDLPTRSGGSTPLQRASYRGQKEVVRLLLNSGSNVLLQDSDGQTALHKAAEGARTEVAAMLIGKNKDLVTIKDNRGRFPRDCASPINNELLAVLSM